MSDPSEQSDLARLAEVIQLFLKLGLTAFGGPAAYIAMMRDEVVNRHKWVDEQRFLDLVGAANLLPGPTATELAIYLGFQRIGWLGLVLGGVCFILPAMLITMALGWAYIRYGTTVQAGWLFYGIKPVIIAIIVSALWGMGRKALKNWITDIIGLVVIVLYLLGANIFVLLLSAGLVAAVGMNWSRWKRTKVSGLFLPLVGLSLPAAVVPFTLPLLFLTFFKVGAVLYGSGYVLLAFLHTDFVSRLGWLTDRQLVDAIAMGQITPGPVFTTATFIGYLLGGVPGALLATLGIFLPSFFYVAVSGPLLPSIRKSPWAAAFLDGVNVASVGLMAGVTLQLGYTTLIDPLTVVIALFGFFLLLRFRINSTWLIAGGACIGVLHAFL